MDVLVSLYRGGVLLVDALVPPADVRVAPSPPSRALRAPLLADTSAASSQRCVDDDAAAIIAVIAASDSASQAARRREGFRRCFRGREAGGAATPRASGRERSARDILRDMWDEVRRRRWWGVRAHSRGCGRGRAPTALDATVPPAAEPAGGAAR